MHTTLVNDPDLGRQVEPMNLADLQFWIEDNPNCERGYWRYCWVSRNTLRCEFYNKFTSRACDNARDRLWPKAVNRFSRIPGGL